MSCPWTDDFKVSANLTYGQFKPSLIENIQCSTTYLRPSIGGALIPWLYALLLFVVHLPACIIRVVRWEHGQYLALVLAAAGVFLTMLAYCSTNMKADEVLVWMPLTLVLDIGAMLQMVILIIEEEEHPGLWNLVGSLGEVLRLKRMTRLWNFLRGLGNFLRLGPDQGRVKASRNVKLGNMSNSASPSGGVERPVQGPPELGQNGGDTEQGQVDENRQLLSQDRPAGANAEEDRADPDEQPCNGPCIERQAAKRKRVRHRHALVALLASILLVWLFVLQIYGLKAAIVAKSQKDLKVNWCSPAFRDFAVAISTGNCEMFDIVDSGSNGIGCIAIPAKEQERWLIATIALLIASLIAQVGDVVLLACVDKGKKVNETRLRRPWCSIFGGTILLMALIGVGIANTHALPPGMTSVVWIYRQDPGQKLGRVCKGALTTPGLRGTIIGWTDGLLHGWGDNYNGYAL